MSTDEQAQHDSEASDEDVRDNGGSSRTRSKIGFPYTPLADAEQVAQALHQRGGKATIDELAAELNQVITSGAFRTKVATARTFGVASVRRGQATLTPLGHRIVDPSTAPKARSEAFLTVPLYRAIYDEFKGHALPPASGIEAQMERLGVSAKQTDRARQAFQRSAEQAGFFGKGPGRLVAPVVDETETKKPKKTLERGDSILPRAVEALMSQLLEEGDAWSADETLEFVNAARTIYKLSG